MINVVGSVDLAASSGTTVWHRASALSKLVLALLLVMSAVFTKSLASLVLLAAIAWTLALSSRLPVRVTLALLVYPMTFAGLFVLATWSGVQPALLLALRPMTACLTAAWLVATTPTPDLFAPISRFLPRSMADGLFITYRALFELLGRAERLRRALTLRGGGAESFRRRLTTTGECVGTLVLYSFERSERLYATMLLRGHSGRICGCRHYADVTRDDAWVAACAVLVIGAGVLPSVRS